MRSFFNIASPPGRSFDRIGAILPRRIRKSSCSTGTSLPEEKSKQTALHRTLLSPPETLASHETLAQENSYLAPNTRFPNSSASSGNTCYTKNYFPGNTRLTRSPNVAVFPSWEGQGWVTRNKAPPKHPAVKHQMPFRTIIGLKPTPRPRLRMMFTAPYPVVESGRPSRSIGSWAAASD